MLKVTIYPTDSLQIMVEYIEGVTEVGGERKVKEIKGIGARVSIGFENGEFKDFVGFRYITDKINEPKTT